VALEHLADDVSALSEARFHEESVHGRGATGHFRSNGLSGSNPLRRGGTTRRYGFPRTRDVQKTLKLATLQVADISDQI